MSYKINPSRRNFLRAASALSVAGAGTPFALNLLAMGSATAQTADYKALVCLFMAGGNDQANTVLATDSSSWSEYQRIRKTSDDASSIALPAEGLAGGVLPISPNTVQSGRTFALNPYLGAVKSLFDSGRAAIVANVGPLIMPTTLTEYKTKSVPLPPKLFSHNDQQSLWQSYEPEGANVGWGGRMGDMLASMNGNTTFTCISTNGNAVYLAGKNIIQYQVSASGAVPIHGLAGSLFGLPSNANPLQAIITDDSSHLLEKEHAAIVGRSIAAQSVLSTAMLPAGTGGIANPTQYTNPSTGNPENNPLATQLQTVARIIAGRSGLSARRQVFFVSIGGFDTHDNEIRTHSNLMARLGHALSYFDQVLEGMPGGDIRHQVTTFTASDFGRTFASNGDGTDHGWGSHHFVVGGAVKGKDVYGTFPETTIGHALDVGAGSLLPSISVDQYGATLASWFGLSNTQVHEVFPNILNFSNRNLGFML